MNIQRRVYSWLRSTLLDVAIGGHLTLCLVVAVFLASTLWREAAFLDAEAYWGVGLCLSLSAAAYGLFRAWYFNPLEHSAYGAWLAQTPWRYPMHLPLGPVTLRPQDAVFLAIVSLSLPLDLATRVSLPVVAFACGYCSVLWWCAVRHREYGFAYGLPGIVGLVIPSLLLGEFWMLAVIAVLGLAFSQVALGRCLKGFPAFPEDNPPLEMALLTKNAEAANRVVSRLTAELLEDREESQWPPQHAAAGGGLAAWLLACVFMPVDILFPLLEGQEALPAEALKGAFAMASAPVFLLAATRAMVYCLRYPPPISVFGRIATGRLLLPGYDIALAPSVFAAVFIATVPGLLYALGIPLTLAFATPAGIAVACLLGLPPSMNDWRHTGSHRIQR